MRRYFQLVGYASEEPIHFGVPVAIPVKPLSHYLHDSDGLNSVYTPTGHKLLLTKTLSEMHVSFHFTKESYITSFMLLIFCLVSMCTKPDDITKETSCDMGKDGQSLSQ